MDNQQRKLELRLAWLGGFWDGEGYITVAYRQPERRCRRVQINPMFGVVNTNPAVMDEVAAVLTAVGIPHHRSSRIDKRPNCKPLHKIVTTGFKRCARSLPILIPYLVGKREQAEKLLHLCQQRLAVSNKTPYSPECVALAAELREVRPNSKSLTDYMPKLTD